MSVGLASLRSLPPWLAEHCLLTGPHVVFPPRVHMSISSSSLLVKTPVILDEDPLILPKLPF